ncbi:MAG: class I SAM-dependent methyltransferase [Gemmatimonadota bacterium]
MTDSAVEWFQGWFGERYLELYPHRNEEEARRGVQTLLKLAELTSGARVLDLACGAGRHLRPLEQAGHAAFGLDLSWPLLAEARVRQPKARLVRGDMRWLPFRSGAFEAVTSFFTSFGYFATPEEDRLVAGEIRRLLRPGGVFVLDFLNAGRVAAELVPHDVQTVGGATITQRRTIENGIVIKRIVVERQGAREEFEERVRLYGRDALEGLLERSGLRTDRALGDYTGEAFAADSPRLILFGHAA